MKFRIVCVISVSLVFATYFTGAAVIWYSLTKYEIRDGLPFIGLTFMEIIMMAAIALTIIIQVLLKYYIKRKKAVKTI